MLSRFRTLLLVPYLRRQVVLLRIYYFVRIRRRLRSQNSKEAFEVTVKHNLKGLKMCNNRMDLLIRPLASLELLNGKSRILVVGPRNENDIFSLYGHGFRWGNIYGLDLISYSKKICLGDMHKMPFPDNFFDAVLCGWTLSYSSEPRKAAVEMLRVVKDGGIVGIGVEYSTMGREDLQQLLGYSIQDYSVLAKRINSTRDILDLFGNCVRHLFFDHDAPNRISHSRNGHVSNVSNVIAIFSVEK